jgi:Bacterial Ig domain
MAKRGLTALAAVAALLLPAPAAHAATGSPPVTHPDTVTIHAGDGALIDPADNDSDPDGDSLQVCRLGPDVPRALSQSFVQGGDLIVSANRRARGTYTLTYYVCDSSYLTAGTVTVHVEPPAPTLDIIPIGHAPPGKLRIKNTYKHRAFHCTWGPVGEDLTEGKATVKPRSSVVIRVHEANVDIECRSGNVTYGFGFVTGRAPVGYRTSPTPS